MSSYRKFKINFIIFSAALILSTFSVEAGLFGSLTGCGKTCTKAVGANKAPAFFEKFAAQMENYEALTEAVNADTDTKTKTSNKQFVTCLGCKLLTVVNFTCNVVNALENDEHINAAARLIREKNDVVVKAFAKKFDSAEAYTTHCEKNLVRTKSENFSEKIEKFYNGLTQEVGAESAPQEAAAAE